MMRGTLSSNLSKMPPLSGRVETIECGRVHGWVCGQSEAIQRSQLRLRIDDKPVAEIRLSGADRDGDSAGLVEFAVDLPDCVRVNSIIGVIEAISGYILPLAPDLEADYENILKMAVLHNLGRMSLEAQEESIVRDGLFDAQWYLKTFGDIAGHSVFSKNPLRHWLAHGFAEGRNPSAVFDTEYYMTRNRLSDEEACCNSLLHYHFIGQYTNCKIYSFGRPHSRNWKTLLEERHAADRNGEIYYDFINEISSSRLFADSDSKMIGDGQCQGIKVSVIMPFYNRADTLGHAARSALSQTHRNIELILVDDGSTNSHEGVLAGLLADPRVKLSRIPHSGVSSARNAGLATATGEYVCFLDSDNIWNPAFIDTMLSMMAEDKALAAYSGMHRYQNGRFCYFFNSFDLKKLQRENFIDINSVIFHKSLLNNEYFDEVLYRLNDWDFMIRIFKKCEPASYNFSGVAYFDMFRGDRISDIPVSQELYVMDKYEQFVIWSTLKTKKRIPGMISIIMAMTGSPSRIMKCLHSLVAHTNKPCEIILVDGNDDPARTEDILNVIAGKEQIKYTRLDGDYNWSLAYNLGFACSRGEYVCFLDGNDIMALYGWLDELVAALGENDGFAVPICQEDGRLQGIEAVSIFSQVPYALDMTAAEQMVCDSRTCAASGPCFLERAADFVDERGFSAAFIKGGAMLLHTLSLYAKRRRNGVVAVKSRIEVSRSTDKYAWWGDWSAYNGLKDFSVLPNDVEVYASWGFFPYEYQMAAISPECRSPYVKSVKLASRRLLGKADLSILIIKPSGIGNMLFTMPLLAILSNMLPQARIDVLCFVEEAPIAAKIAHKVITMDRTKDSINGWKDEFAVICAEQDYDIVMVPPGGIDKNTPGVAKVGALVLAHPWIDWNEKHEVEHCLDLARMLGFRGSPGLWRYPVSSRARRLCAEAYIAVHIGASDSPHMQKKLWPLQNWARLLEVLASKRFIYLVQGPNEHAINNELLNLLEAQTKEKVIVKITESVDDCANYLQYSEAVIALDGGIGHLANHIGIPVVMLFGPTSVVKGAPMCDFAPVVALLPDPSVTCAPCYPAYPERLLNCEHRKCLASITPERVLEALDGLGVHVL